MAPFSGNQGSVGLEDLLGVGQPGQNDSRSPGFWANLACKVGITTCLHPIENVKTLIQIGHEPLAPTPTKTLFGKPALALPSVFKYMKVIRQRDGILGLYRGVLAKQGVVITNEILVKRFEDFWPPVNGGKPYILGSSENTDEKNLELLVEEIKRGCAVKVCCVLATQPFQVIAVRTIAQFVGRETKYSGIFGGIMEVMNESGILGFWQGWIPRALGEMLLVIFSSSVTYLTHRYILTDKQMQKLTSPIAAYVGSVLFYPFQVISNCMVVSRSGLAAGYPPHMPFYGSWRDCYSHLKAQNQLKRGSGLLFRYYTGPQVIVGNRVLPMNTSMLKMN